MENGGWWVAAGGMVCFHGLKSTVSRGRVMRAMMLPVVAKTCQARPTVISQCFL